MEGACNCGKVRVRINDSEMYTKRRGHICHCLNCRRASGSALATNLAVEADKVEITGEDNLSVYPDEDTMSGNVVRRYFCKTCGSPIKSATDPLDKAGKTILKLGVFEKIPEPEMESFVKDTQSWEKPLTEGLDRYLIARNGQKA